MFSGTAAPSFSGTSIFWRPAPRAPATALRRNQMNLKGVNIFQAKAIRRATKISVNFDWALRYDCRDAELPSCKAKLREDRRPAVRPNETWAMDFVLDQLATGRKVLTVVDTFSRFSPALEPTSSSFRGADVVVVLERVGREVGWPSTIRVDLGRRVASRDLDLWAYQRGLTLDFSRPGKPTDNALAPATLK